MNRKALIFWLVVLPDIVWMFVALWLTIIVRYGGNLVPAEWQRHFDAFAPIYLVWLLVFFMHNLFEAHGFRRYTGLVFSLFSAMVVNVLVAIVYFYFQPDLIFTPRRFLLVNAGLAFAMIGFWHLLIKSFLTGRLRENLYLFSFTNELQELEKEVVSQPFLGYAVLGHLTEQNIFTTEIQKNSSIVLPDNLRAKPEILQKFYDLRNHGVVFYNHKNFYERLLRKVYLSQIDEVWFLENIHYKEKRLYNFLKRSVDILIGVLGFTIFFLTFPLLYLAVKLGSKGPVLFVQDRVGKMGKVFKVYKYRTMSGGPTNTWTAVNDPRITKVGRFLRLSRLDELPQFINLILGNMSLVGPRPEQSHIVEEMKKQIPFYNERHLAKPGITGWAQLNVYAGTLEETREKLRYDLYYLKHRGLLFDLEIILKTVYYIFTFQGR